MTEESSETLASLLARLQPFTSSGTFGGVELRDEQVHLYVVGGVRAARSAGVTLNDELSRRRLTVHDCPYSHRELADEVKRLSSLLLTSTKPELASVISLAPRADGTGLQITCRPGASIGALRAMLRYPFDVEWGSPPTTAPTR